MTGILTVLHCAAAGARATKTYGPDPEDPGRYVLRKGYDAGTKFRAAELLYDRIDDLAGHFGWLAGEPRKLIIPGRLTALGRERIANGQVVYRRSVTDPVCFEEQPFGFLFADTDGLPLPAGVDETGEEALAILEEASPPDLRGASHTRHFSSSAGLGIKPGLRVHRAWALARAYTAAELTAYAEEANEKAGAALFDPAVFRPVQPIYTADTVFEGCPDPLAGERFAFVRGDRDAVELTIRSDASTRSAGPAALAAGSRRSSMTTTPARPGTGARPSSPASGSTRSPTVPRTTPSRGAPTGCAHGRRRSCTSA